ncbi:hypothetical protein COB64_00115 [Candidatus Wolfebacteria bacterium]|nr:MAG: hypothetical protein COB64_00115 [Candidatus Wolfebacteria bacterium]
MKKSINFFVTLSLLIGCTNQTSINEIDDIVEYQIIKDTSVSLSLVKAIVYEIAEIEMFAGLSVGSSVESVEIQISEPCGNYGWRLTAGCFKPFSNKIEISVPRKNTSIEDIQYDMSKMQKGFYDPYLDEESGGLNKSQRMERFRYNIYKKYGNNLPEELENAMNIVGGTKIFCDSVSRNTNHLLINQKQLNSIIEALRDAESRTEVLRYNAPDSLIRELQLIENAIRDNRESNERMNESLYWGDIPRLLRITQHEAFHAIYHHFGDEIHDHSLWREHYKKLQKASDDSIKSSSSDDPRFSHAFLGFLEWDLIADGHSWDSETEFFASFMVTLYSERQWEKVVWYYRNKYDKDHMKVYEKTLRILIQIIEESDKLQKTEFALLLNKRFLLFDE